MKNKDQIVLESLYSKEVLKEGDQYVNLNGNVVKKQPEHKVTLGGKVNLKGDVVRDEYNNNEDKRNVPPVNWDKGFEFPMKIGSGGKEIPFKKNGKWYLYVWDSKNNKHFYYCYDDDIYHPDTEFDSL
jgi:hypothetical protein